MQSTTVQACLFSQNYKNIENFSVMQSLVHVKYINNSMDGYSDDMGRL